MPARCGGPRVDAVRDELSTESGIRSNLHRSRPVECIVAFAVWWFRGFAVMMPAVSANGGREWGSVGDCVYERGVPQQE